MIPFLDLKAQYASIKPEIDAAVTRGARAREFVLGSDVSASSASSPPTAAPSMRVAVNTGTRALHLALLAAGVGPGDEVITVPFTFVATVAAIRYTGATPVFVDIDPVTFTMDPAALEAAITPRTKAIVPVHLYGRLPTWTAIMAIASRHGLAVIEDAAQAHGAESTASAPAPSATIGCFSFYPGKNLGAYGEGGAVVTDDADYAAAHPAAARLGPGRRSTTTSGKASTTGWTASRAPSSRQAALPAEWTERRRANAALYDERLADSGVGLPAKPAGARACLPRLRGQATNRDRMARASSRPPASRPASTIRCPSICSRPTPISATAPATSRSRRRSAPRRCRCRCFRS